jgi:chorismate mutase / prephenate dehydratase
MAAMALDDYRSKIDALDDEILRLLDERAGVVEQLAREKRDANMPRYDPKREQQILDRLAGRASRFPADAIRAVYREVMSACLALQEPVEVAYLGPEGTFSHAAARAIFGLAAGYCEQPTIASVFDAVEKGDVAYGVAPIENSSEGSVAHALDALIEGRVRISGEYEMEVSHCLLARAGLASIERVYSHPQALGQCRMWLAKNLASAQIVQTTSTAAAAREALGDARGGAIASRLCAELYGVPVVRERIQDHPENRTRFVLLSLEAAGRSGHDKTTLAFSLQDGRGALKRVLDVFEEEGINLTRIESRPSQKRAWDYVFLVDLEGHKEDAALVRAGERLAQVCPMVKHLGSYPRAR